MSTFNIGTQTAESKRSLECMKCHTNFSEKGIKYDCERYCSIQQKKDMGWTDIEIKKYYKLVKE